MFLTMFYKKQDIVLTMPLTMLIAHPYLHLLLRETSKASKDDDHIILI